MEIQEKIIKQSVFALTLALLFLSIAFFFVQYSTTAASSVTPTIEQKNSVQLYDPIVISYNKPVSKKIQSQNIQLSPSSNTSFEWNKDLTQVIIRPNENWKPETTYTISLSEKSATPRRLSFQTVPHPHVTNITPKDGTEDVFLGAEDPIIVDFSTSTEGFFVDFDFSPDIPVVYQNNPEKTQFKILPTTDIQDGKEYTLTIRSKSQNASSAYYEEIFTSRFSTLPPPPETWAKDLQERLVQVKTYTRPQIKTGKYIDVNLATQTMLIFENGKLLDGFIISSGKPGMGTPKGTHQIYNKHPKAWSSKYGLYMPYWMAITPDGAYGIHELPEWPSGYKEGQNHLGIPVSHGCIRLGIGGAQTVYDWAEISTPVIVY